MNALPDLVANENRPDGEVIATGFGSGFGLAGMATIFSMHGKFHAAPGISDYARKSLTVKEAKWLLANGKTVEYTPPHL